MSDPTKNSEFSPEQVKKILSTPEARQLMALLRSDGGDSLQRAANEFRRGNTAAAQELLRPLMENPQADALLDKFRKK